MGKIRTNALTIFSLGLFIEAERIPDAQEVAEKSDIENRDAGLRAYENENCLGALEYFMGISDNSAIVTNKQDLIRQALMGYISQMKSLADEELNYDNFDKAKNLIESALQYVSDDTGLLEEYQYILLREELYKIRTEDDNASIISFI